MTTWNRFNSKAAGRSSPRRYGVKVIKLKGKKSYGEWMSRNHDNVKVIDVVSTKRRSNTESGAPSIAVKSDKNYTVTYEEEESKLPMQTAP
jgi:hypothetical protein